MTAAVPSSKLIDDQLEQKMEYDEACIALAKLIMSGHFEYEEDAGRAIQVLSSSYDEGADPAMCLALAKTVDSRSESRHSSRYPLVSAKRRGKIRFRKQDYDKIFPQVAMHLGFLTLHVDNTWHVDEVVVTGESAMFDNLSPGECTPFYLVTTVLDDEGTAGRIYVEREDKPHKDLIPIKADTQQRPI